jgi:regulator of protease activity HflC (stomatin/prohibitin superfamily)
MQKKKLNKYYRNISITLLITVFFFIALSDRIIIKIPAGHIGVLYHLTKGTQTNSVYSEGYKLIWPIHTMYIYDARKQIIQQNMDVLSEDGLKIKITVTTRFRPIADSLGVIHKNLGIDYVNIILKPEIESSTRKIISKYDPEELYTKNRAAIENEVTEDSKTEFGKDDIIVDDIMIKNIELPSLIANAIESKLVQEQKNLEYEYILQKENKEAQRKLIEAQGIRKFNDSSGISILTWKGIDATVELAKSDNTKIVLIGNDSKSLPLILNTDSNNKKE